jgi:hypothetical protein
VDNRSATGSILAKVRASLSPPHAKNGIRTKLELQLLILRSEVQCTQVLKLADCDYIDIAGIRLAPREQRDSRYWILGQCGSLQTQGESRSLIVR